jgi:RHS repeat-associated protein
MQTEKDGEISKFVFSGWNIVAELDKDYNVKASEVRGYNLLKKEVEGSDSENTNAQTSNAENKSYFYNHNEHGDVTHLIDEQNQLANQYEYDVFGNIVDEHESIGNNFKYAGEQLDTQTGQYYLRARFYNPILGRFSQEDVYRGDGLNLYVYVVNNPIMWIDPSGFDKYTVEEVLPHIQIDSNGNKYILNHDHDTAYRTNTASPENYKGKLQSHHMLQFQWGKEQLKNYGYKFELAPTITLETNGGVDIGKPQTNHTAINSAQTSVSRVATRKAGTLSNGGLQQQLILGANDLLNVGFSKALVLKSLDNNYKMIEALNKSSSEKISKGELPKLTYSKKEIEKSLVKEKYNNKGCSK